MALIPNPWRGLGGLPREVWALSAATLVNRMGTMVLPFMVLYLTRGLGFPAERAATVLLAYGAGSLVSAPLSGRLADRVGPLRVMKGSLFLTGAVLFLFPLARTLPAILALTLVWSVIAEALRPANLSVLADVAGPEQRKAVIALNRLAVNLGMSIGPVVGGFLAAYSFPALFIVDGATSIGAALVLSFALAGSRLSKPAHATAAERAAVLSESGGVMRDRRMLFFLLSSVLVSAVFFQHVGPLPLFLVRDLGIDVRLYGAIFAINTVLIVFLEVPLNLATAHWSHRFAMALGAMLTAVGYGALAFATGPLTVALTVVCWTFGEMVLFPTMSAFVAEAAPDGRRGEYMGAYTMSFGLAFTVGPWAGTLVYERLGGAALWGAAFALGALAAGMMARVGDAEPAAEAQPAAAA
ncbi:MAG TPA: MFS transporter [Longimicrobiaceae bacterium]|nr:MFS transporter [Longimicrobiaceae bacterium]